MNSGENRISPTPGDYSPQNESDKTSDKNILNSSGPKIKKPSTSTKVFLFSFVSFIITSCIVLIIVLVIYGAFPCSVAKCHPNAQCINKPFYADCICNYGFAGNGLECDECGNFQENWNSAMPFMSVTTPPHTWPATADILFNYRANYFIDSEQYLVFAFGNCGGTLINRKAILTTASCIKDSFNTMLKNVSRTIPVTLNTFHDSFESMYEVFLAVVNQISFSGNIAPARHAPIEKIIKHELYDPETDDNDIAIIMLRDRVELDDKVQLSCLPSREEDQETYPSRHQYAWGAGWGSSRGDFRFSRELKNYRLDIYNDSMCSNISKINIFNLDNDVFCAGEYNVVSGSGKTGNCHGDYGGSLYVRQNISGIEKFVTAGMLSYNEGCNIPHSPGIYTNVVRYLEWIRVNSQY
ncbi:unnamed protein product [Brachionus calyciflorus]|uniref:Uncharacterized protein n=1 Tax=Brachionus calyciflorus TaxID=104777 RepID=A0A814IVI0_9BILA|nr:unnamed protein product [Brachionus calyciflorus]